MSSILLQNFQISCFCHVFKYQYVECRAKGKYAKHLNDQPRKSDTVFMKQGSTNLHKQSVSYFQNASFISEILEKQTV